MQLRQKITSRHTVVGTWVSIPDIAVVEILAQAGFDYLLIDGEHAPISPSQLFPLAVAAERHGCPVVYRVQTNSADLIKAALDIGVAGLMVPMVESPDEAAAVVTAAKYPPAGRRGMGPWRASNYYRDFQAYVAAANEQTAVIVQIESAAAVDKAAEIAAVPGIDALFVGPADLAGSLGLPVGALEPPLLEALKRVVTAGRTTGCCAGIDAPSNERLETFAGLGFSLFAFGADAGYLNDGARATAEFARAAATKITAKSR
ncbi:MAG: HpcH/HpaI aldolase/citrate lyase family protein [Dongiaceae bacterium]